MKLPNVLQWFRRHPIISLALLALLGAMCRGMEQGCEKADRRKSGTAEPLVAAEASAPANQPVPKRLSHEQRQEAVRAFTEQLGTRTLAEAEVDAVGQIADRTVLSASDIFFGDLALSVAIKPTDERRNVLAAAADLQAVSKGDAARFRRVSMALAALFVAPRPPYAAIQQLSEDGLDLELLFEEVAKVERLRGSTQAERNRAAQRRLATQGVEGRSVGICVVNAVARQGGRRPLGEAAELYAR